MPLSKIVAKSITDDTITTDQIADTSVHGRRNLIINGAMNHWQRGTTHTYTANDSANYHTADRWGHFLDFNDGSGSLSVTISQSTDVPAGQGFAYSLKGATTPSSFAKSGSDNLALFTQKVETYNAAALQWGTSGARKATLSYWIKSDTAGTGTLQIRLTDSSSVSGAADGNFYTKFTVNAADTWEYKTHEIPANSTDGWRYTVSNTALHIHWYFGSNQSDVATEDAWFRSNNHGAPHSDNTYDFLNNAGEAFITGVQLEVGDKATPFEHRSFGEELALCQRYAYMIGDPVNSGQRDIVNNGVAFGSTTGYIAIPFPCTMRAEPSLTVNDGSYFRLHSTSGGGLNTTAVSIDGGDTTERMAFINATTSGLTAGQGTLMVTSNSSDNGGTLLFSAEL